MPRGDRTGPAGAGPMTGRGAGYCAGYGVPGYMNPGFGGYGRGGFGGGFGYGGGRGHRWGYHLTGMPGWARGAPGYGVGFGGSGYPGYFEPAPEDELKILKNEARLAQKALDDINKRIAEIQPKNAKTQKGE